MKQQAGIWIDSKKAIIVKLQEHTEKVETIESNIENRIYHDKEGYKGSFSGSQHINKEKTFDEREKHQTNEYIKKIVEHLTAVDDLYIFGPSMIKIILKKEIENNKTNTINIDSIEPSEQLTTNQIISRVKQYFTNK